MSKVSTDKPSLMLQAGQAVKEKATELWESIPKVGVGHAGAMWRQGLKEARAIFFPDSNIAQPTEIGTFGTATQGEVSAERREAANTAPPPANEFSKQLPTVHGPPVAAASMQTLSSPELQGPPATQPGPKSTEPHSPTPSATQPAPVEPPTPTFDDRLQHAATQLEASHPSPSSPSIHTPAPNAPELERE